MSAFAYGRIGRGLALLGGSLMLRRQGDRGARAIAQVLGARQVVQGLGCLGDPAPQVWLIGAEVDLAHLVTALGCAALDRRRRHVWLVQAVVAATNACVGVRLARSAKPPFASTLGTPRDELAATVARFTVPASIRRWAGCERRQVPPMNEPASWA